MQALKNRFRFFALGSAVLLTTMALAGCSDSDHPQVHANAEQFLEHVRTGNIKQAATFVAPAQRERAINDLPLVTEHMEQAAVSRDGFRSMEVGCEIEANLGLCRVATMYGNGEVIRDQIGVIRIEGQWWIAPFPGESRQTTDVNAR